MVNELLVRLLNTEINVVTIPPGGAAYAGVPAPGALLSGSFNPLHSGHEQLALTAAQYLDLEPRFELAVVNADKGMIPLGELLQRAAQFAGRHTLLLSREPLFTAKAALYPGSVFVLGYDTAIRLIDQRYYGGPAGRDQALAAVRAHGCRFLVAGRLVAGRFCTLNDLHLPAAVADLFQELPEQLFRNDSSSSAIRAARSASLDKP